MILGVEGADEVVGTRRVLSNATSAETLQCQLSTVNEQGWNDGEVDECAMVAGKNRKLKFCSICKSVAYCSPEHQRADWKRHKKVCVAPSW
ncbi:hypothetical protein BDY24DRAFT_189552 [Mrakia frigida]|uniref:zinc finger MYND domain-containing protein n=1 Tax=Mrakia frigida TaxID=29902 RepID=UPI003FCC0DD1